ncbi:MAG: rhodanese-like domain-containing protein [Bdellovibrionales bacterium]|nr:rhodanese-like domain-containing protein [Bdellovibrionales bacterium]
MDQLNEIGIYQLENLIIQRVPFKFINLLADQKILSKLSHLNSYYTNFFKEQFLETSLSEPISTIKTLNLPKDTPFIILCQDGTDSKNLGISLEKEGYQNIYILAGGFDKI